MLEEHKCIVCGKIFEVPSEYDDGEEAPNHCQECPVPFCY